MIKLIMSIGLFAILSRMALPPLFGHLPNFSPIAAIALFCGAHFHKRFLAIIVTLFSVWLGDIVMSKVLLGSWTFFYQGWYWQYGSYFLITLLGMQLTQQVKPFQLISACFGSAILFFVISNFGVWYSGLLYPLTLDGLIACYAAAIPFFKNTLFSDLFFAMILFSSFGLIKKRMNHQLFTLNTIKN